jgi:hypothetical protein
VKSFDKEEKKNDIEAQKIQCHRTDGRVANVILRVLIGYEICETQYVVHKEEDVQLVKQLQSVTA